MGKLHAANVDDDRASKRRPSFLINHYAINSDPFDIRVLREKCFQDLLDIQADLMTITKQLFLLMQEVNLDTVEHRIEQLR